MSDEQYDESFYEENEKLTNEAPKIIFEILIKYLNPNSICDVGGGQGLWISKFIKLKNPNPEDVLCIDGYHINKSKLFIPEENFLATDLERPLPKLDKKFDLVLSLEVAEHLSPERAVSFIEELTTLSDAILFSAAFVGQGGTHHINEQFMDYWHNIFVSKNYVPIDIIRPNIQNFEKIPFWYKQNVMLYVKKDSISFELVKNVVNPPLIHTVWDKYYEFVYQEREYYKNLFLDFQSEIKELKLKNTEYEKKIKDLELKTIDLNVENEKIKASYGDVEKELNAIKKSMWYVVYKKIKKV